ncbi:MAG: hypothetical protein LBC40_00585 [Dysgonamonadaceae bacterium]|nr:hypothetical protein [Dysgonamonadaceae bacterium]
MSGTSKNIRLNIFFNTNDLPEGNYLLETSFKNPSRASRAYMRPHARRNTSTHYIFHTLSGTGAMVYFSGKTIHFLGKTRRFFGSPAKPCVWR